MLSPERGKARRRAMAGQKPPTLSIMKFGGRRLEAVSNMTLPQLNEALQPLGLVVIGWFKMTNGPSELTGKSAALIGNRATPMWQAFKSSGFDEDGAANPLDRWTKQSIAPIAKEQGATALYPFLDGYDQHWPFQQWASAATGFKQSPLGLLIDPEFGLWHAFRTVLVFDEQFDIPELAVNQHPCDTCVEKPCLTTCPVAAISAGQFDANICIDHVLSERDKTCGRTGCIARNSCPVGQEHAYDSEQQVFHMRAFVT
jgi:hypothetical protein